MSEFRPNPALPEEDFGIKILRDGTWLHQGRPMVRHNLVKLFATVLKRDENGAFWLQTPAEQGRIEVEDAPFIAIEMQRQTSENGENLLFRTNVDDWVTLDADHPLVMRADVAGALCPYIHIRGAQGCGLEAKLSRAVYYELVALAVCHPEDTNLYGVYSAGRFFALGHAEMLAAADETD